MMRLLTKTVVTALTVALGVVVGVLIAENCKFDVDEAVEEIIADES